MAQIKLYAIVKYKGKTPLFYDFRLDEFETGFGRHSVTFTKVYAYAIAQQEKATVTSAVAIFPTQAWK